MRAALSPKAIRTFATLSPYLQVCVLRFLASLARVKPSALLSTPEQRQARRELDEERRADERAYLAREAARKKVRLQLDELRARINRRSTGAWGTAKMTAAEKRKQERLYAELNKLDGIE